MWHLHPVQPASGMCHHASPLLAFYLSDELETTVPMKIKQTYGVKVTVKISSPAIHYIYFMYPYTRSLSSAITGIIGLGKSQIFERECKYLKFLLHGSCHFSYCCGLQLVLRKKSSTVILE